MQHIRVITGVPGSGKTDLLVAEMATNPARYLAALPMKRLIGEIETRIRDAAKVAGTSPDFIRIDSNQKTTIPVGRAISNLPGTQTAEHTVVLVTHEGLMEAELGAFEGWTVHIDELPNSIANDAMVIPVSSRVLDDVYAMTAVDKDWYRVNVKNAEALNDVKADGFLKTSPFHRRARQGRVFVDVPRFDALTGKRTAVNWFSAWTLDDLAAFDRVTIAAASAVGSLLLRDAKDVEVIDVSPVRSGNPTVLIRYYADSHTGSTAFWKTGVGRECLSAVAADLTKRDIAYWSCNDVITADLAEVGGRKMPPKLAGSNILRQMESCAYIYSAKSQPTDVALRTVFGLSDDDIKRMRETEDIWQFVFRGAIRNPSYGGTYTVYLYDHEQATTLAAMLARVGIAAELELIQTAAAGVVRERAKPGPKPINETPMTPAERKRRQRAKKRKVDDARASFGRLA